VMVGEEFQIVIENLSSQGQGVGHWNGKAVFVSGALPGETVRARLTTNKPKYIQAKLEQVVQPAAERVVPCCPWFGQCGGCDLQHLDYAEQLVWKRIWVAEALKRIGGITEVEVLPAVGMEDPWRYRNRAQLHLRQWEGEWQLGFFRRGSHQILPIEDCCLFPALWRDVLAAIRSWLQTTQPKSLYHIVLGQTGDPQTYFVLLVAAPEAAPNLRQQVKVLSDRLPPGLLMVALNLNPDPSRQVLAGQFEILSGPPALSETILGQELQIHPASFAQVNPRQTEYLYQTALAFADPGGNRSVLELYCGSGVLSVLLARQAGKLIGVDIDAAAIEQAQRNVQQLHISNAGFMAIDVLEYLRSYPDTFPADGIIVLDPPRRGLPAAVIDELARLQPQRIVYISCDPATLARDLKRLLSHGYLVQAVQPVDMFPQTVHVETVVLMSRVEK